MALNSTLGGLDILGSVYGAPGISSLISIGKAVGIVVIVYFVFLIVKTVTEILYSVRFKKLYKNVEEINKKMDKLIGIKEKKK